MGKLKKIVTVDQDNLARTYAVDPEPGQSPISAEMEAVAWAAWRPTPLPEPLKPALPTLTIRRATHRDAEGRGDGLRITQPGTVIRGVLIDGFEQNLVVDVAGEVAIENTRSINAWRGSPADVYEGQGLYIGRGQVIVRDSVFAWNGWQRGRPVPAKIRYRHGIYQDLGAGPLIAEDCIFAFNSSCGVQLRAGGILRRCLFVGNAIHLLAIKEPVLLEDCVFVGGSRHVELNEQNQPRSWVGNCGVSAYSPVTLRRCLFGGTADQAAPNTELPGLRSWDMGVINVSSGHDKHPTGVGSIDMQDVVASGWPISQLGNRAAGNREAGDAVNTVYSGVPGLLLGTNGILHGRKPVGPAVMAAVNEAIDQTLSNDTSVKAAIAAATALVRKAVP
jgi:hypothetical protein